METNAESTYNGWANYETWTVHLWLTNEQPRSVYWTNRTREVLADVPPGGDTLSVIVRLGNELCEVVSEECSSEGASLAADLTTTALAEVDWFELAESFVEDSAPLAVGKVVPLGVIVATPGVIETLTPEERDESLARHARGDWGDVDAEDWAENEFSLEEGLRLLSTYRSATGVKYWIITEADRSVTTLLLPNEY